PNSNMLPSPTPSPSSLHLSNRDSDIDSNQNPWVQNDGLPQGGHDYSNPSTIALSDPARVAGLAVGMACKPLSLNIATHQC
ncbi:hypothetical protein KEM55_006352, partial [Ascosphaera atra]